MQTRIFILAALLNVVDTQAATEFGESIPTEVVKLFMGLEGDDGGVYSDIPDDFPDFKIPRGITLIGSVDRREGSQAVYLRTNLDEEEARNALQQGLIANGWHLLEFSGRRAGPQVGFAGNGIVAIPSMLCHDEHGNLQIRSQRSGQHNVIVISRVNIPMDPATTCAGMSGEWNQPAGLRDSFIGNPLEVELPRLKLPPEGSVGRQSGITGGISGSTDDIRTTTSMQISWELPAVLEHFSTQVNAQGWTPQGEWNTALSAGGSWTSTAQSGADLLGILDVIRKAPGDYLLEFRVVSTPRTGG